jgi:hypothetical protein
METNFIDEIFERIRILEQENKILIDELKNINNESEINIDNYITIDKNEKLNQLNEFKMQINLDNFTSKNINENQKGQFTEITINYKPFEDLHAIEIAGDFSNWNKKKMEKVNFIF